MDDDLRAQIAELNRGAAMMDAAKNEKEKLAGASIVSGVGLDLVDTGGKPLLERAHSMVDPQYQRTVELQWYGLTDKNGYQWLP